MCTSASGDTGGAGAGGYAAGAGTGAASGAATGSMVMPGWGTAIGAGLGALMGAGGTYLRQSAGGDVAKQRKKVLAAETERQAGYQAEAQGTFGDALARFQGSAQGDNRQSAEDYRRDVIGGQIVDPGASGAGADASNVVKSELARQISSAIAAGRDRATRMARLGSYGANQFGNVLALNRSGQQLNQLGNFAGSSANLAGLGLDAAGHLGANKRFAGDLFSSAAPLATMAGLMYDGGSGAPST